MNIIKRLKYLWRLSRNSLTYKEQVSLHYKDIGFQEKPVKMAQIIKRRNPLKEVLTNEEKENG